MKLLTLLVVLLLAHSASAALPVGDSSHGIVVGGVNRTYIVHVPASYTGATFVPLVLDFHGLSSTASQQEGISGFNTVSDSVGFIVVYPQGINNAFNGGICCSTATDDVAFTRALVARMRQDASIDVRRTYVTGLSNGGAMTQRLACEAADIFAAAAPFSFPISVSPPSACVPSRPIPVLTFMGLTDQIVPYNGGQFPSAAATFTHWLNTDQCGSEPPEIHTVTGASYCDIDTSCAAGTQVGLCSITSTSGAPFPGHVLYINNDLFLAQVAWNFMSQFTLPATPAPTLPGEWPIVLGGLLLAAGAFRWRLAR